MVCYYFHYFAWVKSQVIPSDIFTVFAVVLEGLLPFTFVIKACLGSLS